MKITVSTEPMTLIDYLCEIETDEENTKDNQIRIELPDQRTTIEVEPK